MLGLRVVRVAVACAVGLAGVALSAGPALAVECPGRATACRDWPAAPGQGWREGVVCPEVRSSTVSQSVRNLTSNDLTLAVGALDCYDWSNTGNPSKLTGRVVSPGATAAYRLEPSRRSWDQRYDLGVLVPEAGALRLGGLVNVWSQAPVGTEIRTTNTGATIGSRTTCRRQPLGADPQRTRSRVSFDWRAQSMTTIYSDGENLYAVGCQSRAGTAV